jgi:predicted nucleic acid-binding protein
MRFVDASVFVHAFIRPRRELRHHERSLKSKARGIVARINEGESVVTSVVHFAEVANLLEDWMPFSDALTLEREICNRDTIVVQPVDRHDLIVALSIAAEASIGMTDALAVSLMDREGIREVYSFDKDFDRIPKISRVAE